MTVRSIKHNRLTELNVLAVQPIAVAMAAVLLMGARPTIAEGGGENWQLEEITVTARKRAESLQDAPIAISAFSSEGLSDRGITQLNDLQNVAPNLTFQNNPSFGGASSAAAIYIRGIGQKDFVPTVDPGVGIYLDGIYVARSVGAIFDLVEIEQVEILRGPQGTLFGRNTIGGAMSITSKKPNEVFEGNVQMTLGSDSRVDIKSMVNVPFTDNFMGRFSLAKLTRDGYVKRSFDGLDLGDDDTLTGRAAFRWTPSDAVDIDMSIGFTEDDENGPAIELLGINYAGPIDPETPPLATIHNVGANLAAGGSPAPCIIPGVTGTTNLAVPACYDNRYVTNNGVNHGTSESFSKTDLLTSDITVTWEVSENLTFKSLTGYRDLDSSFGRDGDGSPHRVAEFLDELDQQQFTQEFQLLGTSEDQRLNWILGLYYFEEDGNNINTLDFSVSNFVSGGKFDNESKAVFMQAGYDITDDITVTLGLRYTDESKTFTPDQFILTNYFAGSGDPSLDAPFMQAGSRILPKLAKEISIEETTPMLNVRWQVRENVMLYASYSEGFKSGGFSQRVFPPQVAGATAPAGTADIDLIPSFEPEFVESTEIGLKYTSEDGRLRINAAIFDTRYDDFQIQVFTSVAPVTKNAASVGIQGGELELTWAPAEGWMLETSVGITDAQYETLSSADTLISKSNDLERVPDMTLSAAISKETFLSDGSAVTVRLDWSYRADQEMDTFNSPEIRQDSYSLLNANVRWTSADEKYEVMLGGTNLADEKYLVSGIVGDAFQAYEGVYARGSEWYLKMLYNF